MQAAILTEGFPWTRFAFLLIRSSRGIEVNRFDADCSRAAHLNIRTKHCLQPSNIYVSYIVRSKSKVTDHNLEV